jgi:hypothetical protein
MSTNLTLTNDTMTYAEYINCFIIKRYIKRHLIKLNFPLDEMSLLSNMSEEELFLRKWDIETFGLNKTNNIFSSNMWMQKEMNKFIE